MSIPIDRDLGRARRRVRRWRMLGVLVAAGMLSGIVGAVPVLASTSITIRSGGCTGGGALFCYSPESAIVATGAKVTWANQSGAPHTATICDTTNCPGAPASTGPEKFAVSINSTNGSTGAFTFTHAGAYYYYCQVHGYANMHAKITVFAAPMLTSVKPSAVARGHTYSETLSGSHFTAGATVHGPSGVTFSKVAVKSPSTITATMTISSAAATGTKKVLTVINPASAGSGRGSCACLTIN